MKRMLIIGTDYPGIKSVTWPEVTTLDITDYQIILADFNEFSPLDDLYKYTFINGIRLLVKNGHIVIFLLPRKPSDFFANFFHWNLSIIAKSGVTLHFEKTDEIINRYKNFVSKHEIILGKFNQKEAPFGELAIYPNLCVIWNNVDQSCGYKIHTLYLLHSPDIKQYKKAIHSLVDYFCPDIEYIIEEKPEWAKEYELRELGLHLQESKINDIDQRINELTEAKNKIIDEKDRIAKWSDLITSQGKALEIRLKEAFEFLGVEKVQHEPSGPHGPDLLINHKSTGFTIEIEGSKGPIRIEKARELLHWIADAPPDHKGILLGNPFRDLPPNDRPPANNKLFVKETEELAQKRGFVLITTYEIFKLISNKIKGEKLDIDEIFNKILHSKGEITLSDITE